MADLRMKELDMLNQHHRDTIRTIYEGVIKGNLAVSSDAAALSIAIMSAGAIVAEAIQKSVGPDEGDGEDRTGSLVYMVDELKRTLVETNEILLGMDLCPRD